nr:hypothetical protein Iba_chr13eCG4450 [Ipomoea batatas]
MLLGGFQADEEWRSGGRKPLASLNKWINCELHSFLGVPQHVIPFPIHPPRRIRRRAAVPTVLRHELAVLDHQPRRLREMRPSVRRHDVLLIVHRLPHHDRAVLEHRRRVAEDEIDRAGDDAVAVELTRHRLMPLRPRRVLESHGFADEAVTHHRKRRGSERGYAISEALFARYNRLAGPISVHEKINLFLLDKNVFVINSGFYVDDVSRGIIVLLGFIRGQSVGYGGELSAAVFRHHRVRSQLYAAAAGSSSLL